MFDKFSIICLTLPFVVVLVQGQDQVQRGPPDFCIRSEFSHFLDHYYKDAPSPRIIFPAHLTVLMGNPKPRQFKATRSYFDFDH